MDAKHTLGEPRVLISRRALLHNARLIRRAVGPAVRICAIIKADGYGHGAAAAADALCNLTIDDVTRPGAADAPAADALAVASLDEAAALSQAVDVGGTPVLIFRPLENAFVGRQRAKIEEAVRRGWVMTVCTPAAADDVARIALGVGRRAGVQVMVDTGMTRSGVEPAGVDALIRRIEAKSSLRLAGLCTHFASSEDTAGTFTGEQLARFDRATSAYAQLARGRVPRHAANSAAVFFCPASHLDMVRPGLALYGVDPSGRPHVDRPLRPALRWTAPLVGVHTIPTGATVGYGQTWTAARPSRIGLVPVGYADGYPRAFSNRAVVIVHGRPAPVVGRVSMDLTTIDLTDVPPAGVGDEVTLLDDDPLSPASVYRLAAWADTLPYEIFCNIGPRVHRVAVDDVTPDDPAPDGGPPLGAAAARDTLL